MSAKRLILISQKKSNVNRFFEEIYETICKLKNALKYA